jgi:cell wall-associated NlpC family hydrolase
VGGAKSIAALLSLAALAAPAGAAAATQSTGGVSPGSTGTRSSGATTGGAQFSPPPSVPPSVPPTVAGSATLAAGIAYPPPGAPRAVVRAIRAGNSLQDKPYLYGGGHRSFYEPSYDCSGTVSYALHGARLLRAPLNSGSLMAWGIAGPGAWITVYANPGHTYVLIAGLRLDTSGSGGRGPRWQTARRDPTGFVARHPAGL